MTDHKILRAEAERRHEANKNDPHNRVLGKDYEYMGLLGEDTFAIEFNLPLRLHRDSRGDGGYDFITPIGKVDVKTRRKPYAILVEQGIGVCYIVVLGWYRECYDRVELLGWAYGEDILAIPPKLFPSGIWNHAMYQDNPKFHKGTQLLHTMIHEATKQ
jgi:hypothetical protein